MTITQHNMYYATLLRSPKIGKKKGGIRNLEFAQR